MFHLIETRPDGTQRVVESFPSLKLAMSAAKQVSWAATISSTLPAKERQAIYAEEFRRALANIVPNCPGGKYSGQQIAAARGIARKRALTLIDAATPSPTSPEMARKALEKLYAKRGEGTQARQQWRSGVIARLEAVIDAA